nr:hypothetical protein [Streptomyces jeddahensis]
MIKKVQHEVTAPVRPAEVSVALAVANELHAAATPRVAETSEIPAPGTRAREVAVPHLMGLRTTAARPHRRKVPLHRLTPAMC